MARASILLTLLIICVIGTQGRVPRHRNSNTNVNSNNFRRSANTNINTNTFARRNANANINSNTFAREANVHPGHLRQIVPTDYDASNEHIRLAGEEVARCLTSGFGSDISDEDILDVTDAVLEIMGDTRRNSNYNSNSNNFRSSKRHRKLKRDRAIDYDDDAYAVVSSDIPIPVIEVGAETDWAAEETNFNSNANQVGDHVDDKDMSERHGLGVLIGGKRKKVRGGLRVGKPSRARSSNYNENTNSFRRSLSGDGEDGDGQEPEDFSDPAETRRSRGRNYNSNINSNVFRRNLNRNVNVNSNSERRMKG